MRPNYRLKDKVKGVIVEIENGEKTKSYILNGESTLSQLCKRIKALEECTIYDEDDFKMSDPEEKIKNFGKLNDKGYYVINAKKNKKKLSGGDVTLNQLPNGAKKELISSLGLLRGVRIKNGELLSARYPLFKLKNNIKWDNHCLKKFQNRTKITKTMNSSETSMACQGYSKQEIRAEISGYGQSVGGGVAVNNSDSKEQESFEKNEMFVANSLYIRGGIVINEQCVDLSGDFKTDVDKVIHQKMIVQDLEEKYGLFYQSDVFVGASIYCTENVDEKKYASTSEQKNQLNLDFEASVSGFGVNAKVNGLHEHGGNRKQGNIQSSSSSSKDLKCFGDKSDYESWAVINVNEIKSIYNLLPKDKESQMQQIKKKIKIQMQRIKKKIKEQSDYFDLTLYSISKQMTIYNNQKCISNQNALKNTGGGYNTAYGSKVIPSTIKNKTFIWKFKNIGAKTNGVNIGIDNSDANWIHTDFSTAKKQKAWYSYWCDGGEVKKWDQKTLNGASGYPEFKNKGDMLTMRLEFKSNNAMLTFKVNNRPEYIATKNVTQHYSLQYRMAVSSNTWFPIDIELIEFKEI